MPKSLSPIPGGVAIVDAKGLILDFFRLRWQELIDGFQTTPTVAALVASAQSAAVVTTSAFLTKARGRYRVSYYLRKTLADGVASSLTVTVGWTEGGVAQSQTFAALVLDSVLAEQDRVITLRVDAQVDITVAIAYASTTPNRMTYVYDVTVEALA